MCGKQNRIPSISSTSPLNSAGLPDPTISMSLEMRGFIPNLQMVHTCKSHRPILAWGCSLLLPGNHCGKRKITPNLKRNHSVEEGGWKEMINCRMIGNRTKKSSSSSICCFYPSRPELFLLSLFILWNFIMEMSLWDHKILLKLHISLGRWIIFHR